METNANTGEHPKGSTALEFRSVSFAYEGKTVLDDVSFSIGEGEITALVGDNGSGKSTIAKLASLFLVPDDGDIVVLGNQASSAGTPGTLLAMRKGIGLVMQNPDDQLVASIVVDEVAFGPSNLGLSRSEIIERVEGALRDVGMSEHVGANVNTLSGGQRQRISIADALAMKPRLLILDEPTSMLDAQGQQDVRDIALRLRDAGIAVLWVTHSADEALLADRILAIENGKIREHATGDKVTCAERGLPEHGACPPSLTLENTYPSISDSDSTLIRFRDVSFAYSSKNELGIDIFALERDERPVFEHLNLEVLEGETLAIVGPNGCGKSTLLQLLNGLFAPTAGTIEVNGISTVGKEGANAARRVVGLSMQYPERSLFAQSVRDEIAFGPRNAGLAGAPLDERIREAMAMMGLSYDEYADRNPFSLSGGEQRKVALAGTLSMRPKVLALDEPCSSLDAPNHDRLIALLETLKGSGQTIVLVTHDMDDVERLADRIFDMGMQ